MFEFFSDITNSETFGYLGYEVSGALRIVVYIGLEIFFHRIKERYPKITSLIWFLRVLAIFNFIWFFIEYAEFRTDIPIKTKLVGYFTVK